MGWIALDIKSIFWNLFECTLSNKDQTHRVSQLRWVVIVEYLPAQQRWAEAGGAQFLKAGGRRRLGNSTIFQLPENAVKHTFEAISASAIHHVGSIPLHKRRIENNQEIPTE